MPRDGSDVYNVPSGTYGVEDTTIESARYNGFVNDVAQDLNHPRPILAGGTGKQNAREALLNLGGELAHQVITNYDFDPIEPGSFNSATTATASPVAGHAFSGVAYGNDANNLILEARDTSDANVPGRVYVREKKAGVWGVWQPTGLTVIGTSVGVGGTVADMYFGLRGATPNSVFVVNSKADLTGTDLMVVSKKTLQITGQGACPPGALMDFAMATAPAGWEACDGQSRPVGVPGDTYYALWLAIGYGWGGSGLNFSLPPLNDRFRRHRGTAAGAVGALKAAANLSHSHGSPITSGNQSVGHTHAQQGTFTSGGMSQNANHSHGFGLSNLVTNGTASTPIAGNPGYCDTNHTAYFDVSHTHDVTISGNTGGQSASHTHSVTIDADGDADMRPLSAAVLTCIKL